MKKAKISIIAAVGENMELGKGGKLLWQIPEDIKRFKKLTEGHVVIMGRKTFESIGRPLPNRINIIVTNNPKFNEYVSINQLIDTFVAHSLKEAIEMAKKKESHFAKASRDREIFVIGGGQIYQQAMKYADKLYLTIVKGNFEADTFFPDYSQFNKVMYKKETKDKNYNYTSLELEK